MQDWTDNTMRQLKQTIPPAQPAPAVQLDKLNLSTCNLTDCVFDVNKQLYSLMNDVEHLAAKLCGPYTVPGIDDEPPNEGIISQIIWSTNQQRLMIERINSACLKIHQAL